MLAETKYQHIVLDDYKVPVIAGTTMKVVELASAHLAYGWSAEELHFQFPDLTLGQIYSALAYYWDNQSALEDDIEKRLESTEKMRQAVGETPLMKRLKSKGLI
ncbi:MAG: DUF433 domain-containing protein [Anaerolineales bacterium]